MELTDHDESASDNASSIALRNFGKSLSKYASKTGRPITPRKSPRKPVHVHRKADNSTLEMDEKWPKNLQKCPDDSSEMSNGSSPKKQKRGYAEPEMYAHLNGLQDHLTEELDVIFCGINPGKKSAQVGHHFANPTNHFWRCLYEAGFTPGKLRPEDDSTLPERFALGLTNLVERPTVEQSELSASEQISGVSAFLTKAARYRPRMICFVGLGISKTVQAELFHLKGKQLKDLKPGLQHYKISFPNVTGTAAVRETLFFAAPSTSGRVVQFQRSDKVKIFKDLKSLLDDVKSSRLDTTDFPVITLPPAVV